MLCDVLNVVSINIATFQLTFMKYLNCNITMIPTLFVKTTHNDWLSWCYLALFGNHTRIQKHTSNTSAKSKLFDDYTLIVKQTFKSHISTLKMIDDVSLSIFKTNSIHKLHTTFANLLTLCKATNHFRTKTHLRNYWSEFKSIRTRVREAFFCSRQLKVAEMDGRAPKKIETACA